MLRLRLRIALTFADTWKRGLICFIASLDTIHGGGGGRRRRGGGRRGGGRRVEGAI